MFLATKSCKLCSSKLYAHEQLPAIKMLKVGVGEEILTNNQGF